MGPNDIYQFVRNFDWNAETVAALATGLFFGVVIVLGMVGWWIRHGRRSGDGANTQVLTELISVRDRDILALREQIGALRQAHDVEEATLQDEHSFAMIRRDEQVAALSQECECLKEDAAALEQARDKYRQLNAVHKTNVHKANDIIRQLRLIRRDLNGQLRTLLDHQQSITAQEGRFWESKPRGPVPAFRPLTDGKAPIVAVVNLKGGVGKTTLTANLGATLEPGDRVLLADLDNQGSLTALCLSAQRIGDLRLGGGKFVHHLFRGTLEPDGAWNLLTRVDDTESYMLAATEELADVEEHAKAEWLIRPEGRDIRFDLRRILHAPLMQDRFDVMLLDCPPRLSTACVNALTACDYVLVPVLLDKTSADAVPRLLTWLRLLKERGICPELKLLGVVGNRVKLYQKKLVKREANLWNRLRGHCQDAWGSEVGFFDTLIPNKSEFAEAAESRFLAAFDDEVRPFFRDLAAELQQRRTSNANRRPAAIRT